MMNYSLGSYEECLAKYSVVMCHHISVLREKHFIPFQIFKNSQFFNCIQYQYLVKKEKEKKLYLHIDKKIIVIE